MLRQLNQRQVDGLEFLLGEIERTGWAERSLPEVAYALATIGHETAWTFQPINEYRAKPGTRGRANQDRYWLSGYYGRGYVQLTWRANYEKAGRILGVDLVNRPELALEPDVAFQILYQGMISGWFTGKKLADFIKPGSVDYVGARKIINGTDKAEQIAGYARRFEWLLKQSQTSASSAPATIEPEQQSATQNPPVQPTGKPEDHQAEPHGDPEKKPVPGPQPEEVVQYIPKVTRAVRWLGTLGLGGIASTTAAAFNGLPPWAIFALGMLTAVVLGGLIWLFVKYYGRVFDLVKLAVAINADPEKGTVTLVSEKPPEGSTADGRG